jgi:hypothetical protein
VEVQARTLRLLIPPDILVEKGKVKAALRAANVVAALLNTGIYFLSALGQEK